MSIMGATGSGEAKCPCMFDTPRCGGNDCLFGTLLKDANRLYNSYFQKPEFRIWQENENRLNKGKHHGKKSDMLGMRLCL